MEHLTAWRLALPEKFRTLGAAGALLGVSGTQLFRYENGQRRIPAERVGAISAITGIDPEILRPDVFALKQQKRAQRASV